MFRQTDINQTRAPQHFKQKWYLWRTLLDVLPAIMEYPASTYLGLRKILFGIPSAAFEVKYLWTSSGQCLVGSYAVLIRLHKLNILQRLIVVLGSLMLPSNNV